MNTSIVRCNGAELLCDLFQCQHMRNKQISALLNLVAVTKTMMKEMPEEDKRNVKDAIRTMVDYVDDETCKRRLQRMLM